MVGVFTNIAKVGEDDTTYVYMSIVMHERKSGLKNRAKNLLHSSQQ